MKQIRTVLLLFFIGGSISAQEHNEIFELAGHKVQLSGEFGEFETQLVIEKLEEGLEIATISLKHKLGAIPPKFSLKWGLPSSDIAGYWSSGSFNDKTIGPSTRLKVRKYTFILQN